MTPAAAGSRVRGGRLWEVASEWIRKKDPGRLTIKRSVRAAITIPSVFGLAHALSSNAQVGLFGAFGSFSLLLLVDFPGRFRTRLLSYVALWLAGCGLIALGTVLSTDKGAAIAAMAVVGFGVLFAGIVSPGVAAASTATLLIFVLPVAVAEPAGAVGSRLLGWALAGAVGITACMVLWPTPWHDNLRRRLAATVSAVAALAQAHAEGTPDPETQSAVSRELSHLRDQFATTPYPPTGAARGAVALAKLVGRVEWVAGNATQVDEGSITQEMPSIRKMIETVAETLRGSAALICDDHAYPVNDPALVRALEEMTGELDHLMRDEIAAEVSKLIDPEADDLEFADSGDPAEEQELGIASSLDPAFRARALGIDGHGG